MLKRACGGALALLIGFSASARAQQTAAPEKNVLDRGGIDLGAHVGFALAFGAVTQGVSFGTVLSGAFPIGVDLAVRGSKGFAFGVGFEQAPAITRNDCYAGFSCGSATDYRFRFEAIFTRRAGFVLDPWLGLGIGYEWLDLPASGRELYTRSGSIQLTGWDYAIVEAGGELRLGGAFALGPFVGFSLGEYSTSTENSPPHAWVQLGLRGTVNL
ncbi:MAG TPA: hypothetical protein VKZ18_01945 [Polyangia bacterium]|nr:hypothetical protein [Polyangia bacterium]